MNRQKGDMYDFVKYTSNPIKGPCEHDCKYCYMRRVNAFNDSNEILHLDFNELYANHGSGNSFMMGSNTDTHAALVPTGWIKCMYDKCLMHEDNTYLFQSKNPGRFLEEELMQHPLMQEKDRITFVTTIESNREHHVSKAPCIQERVKAMTSLRELGYRVAVTIEPIMQFDNDELVSMIRAIQPSQVNIGCNSDRTITLPDPTSEEITELINELRCFTTVIIKKNCRRILGDLSKI